MQVQLLNESFDAFLRAWETVCYIKPTWNALLPWLDEKTGMFRPNADQAQKLRRLLNSFRQG